MFRRHAGCLQPRSARDRVRHALRRFSSAAGAGARGAGALLAFRPHLHRREFHRQGGRAARCRGAGAGHRGARYQPARAEDSGRRRELRFRRGRRILRRRHASALVAWLPDVFLRHEGIVAAGRVHVSRRPRAHGHLRPFHGRARRADHRAQEPGLLQVGVGLCPDLLGNALPLGRESADGISRSRSCPLAGLRRHRPDREPRVERARAPGRSGHRRPVSAEPAQAGAAKGGLQASRRLSGSSAAGGLRPQLLFHRQLHRRSPSIPRAQPGAIMKKVLTALLCSWCGFGSAQTAEELLNDGKNTENVTTFGMGYDLKMYSPLRQINKSNVRRLVPIWSFSLANDMGEHSQPTIYNGVMYVVNGNWTFAIDVATGRQIWRTPVQYERAALRVGNAGAIMRGPATIYNGKLFRQTVDAHVVALDMKTGKEIWKEKFADFKEGYIGVIAPIVVNGVLISGMAGGDRTTRGFLDGYDPETGKRLWRTYTIPAPGEKGSETWPNKELSDAWKYGGAATWQAGSYDPQLDLYYIGTGNAEPYNPAYRKGMDSLYCASILAIRPKTGEMVWYYQSVPNDSFDFDASAESVLAELVVDGEMRKVLINAHKNGFLYVLDRTNGKLIAANPFVKQNWAKHIDLKTGRPVLTDLLDRAIEGESVALFPARGTNASLIAFNPKTGLVYLNSWNQARVMKYVDFKFQLGAGSTGIETSFDTPKGEPMGYHAAIEPLTGKVKWQVPLMDLPSSAGMLATDGGLLFTGLLTGEVVALDQDNGKRLWQFKTGSSIVAPPITYTHKGRQYVSVLSGIGGSVPTRTAGKEVPAGGSVWTFALMHE